MLFRSQIRKVVGNMAPLARSLVVPPSKTAHGTAVGSFNVNHSDYDALRPSFGKKLVDAFLVDLGVAKKNGNNYEFHTDKTVLELAAGTGKFTRNLVENGWESDNLVIVEPSTGMLESFQKNFPQLKQVHNQSSYNLPVADNSVDTVIVAQGFHWFADKESLREIHRILKPSGTLGLIWNFDYPTHAQQTTGQVAYIDGGSKYFAQLDLSKPADEVYENYFAEEEWSKKVSEYILPFDEDVPQYRKGDWRSVLDNTTIMKPVSHELMYFYEFFIEADQVYPYWETRAYITKLDTATKRDIKTNVAKILDTYAPGQTRLLKPMGTHAIVVPK